MLKIMQPTSDGISEKKKKKDLLGCEKMTVQGRQDSEQEKKI